MIKKQHMLLAYAFLCALSIRADETILRFTNQTKADVQISLIDKGDSSGELLQKNIEKEPITVGKGMTVDLLKMPRGWGDSTDVARFGVLTVDGKMIAEIQERIEHQPFDSDVYAGIAQPGKTAEWKEFDTDSDNSSRSFTMGTTVYTISQDFSDDNPIFILTAESSLGKECTTKSNNPGIITENGCVRSCITENKALGLQGELMDTKTGKPQCFVYTQQESDDGKIQEEFLDAQDISKPLCRTTKGRLGYLDAEKKCTAYCVTEDGYNGTVSSDGKSCVPVGGTVTPEKATPAVKSTSTKRPSGKNRASRSASRNAR